MQNQNQNQNHINDKDQIQIQNLQKEAEELASNLNQYEFNTLMAFHHAPSCWVLPIKIVCLLITNKTLNFSKLYSKQNEAQPLKLNEYQLFSYFKKNTLGNPKKINDLLKSVNTAAITNDIFIEILQVYEKQMFQGFDQKLKKTSLQMFKLWQWSKVLIQKLKVQKKH